MFYFKTCCSFGSPWLRPWQEHLGHFPWLFPLKKHFISPLVMIWTTTTVIFSLIITPLNLLLSLLSPDVRVSELWRHFSAMRCEGHGSPAPTEHLLTHSLAIHTQTSAMPHTQKRPPIMFWCTGLGLHVSVKHVYRRCHSVAELNRKGECGRWSLYTMWGGGGGGYVAMRQVGRVGWGGGRWCLSRMERRVHGETSVSLIPLSLKM